MSGKRAAVDLALIRRELQQNLGCARWIHTGHQLADSLTKMMNPLVLREVNRNGYFQIREELGLKQPGCEHKKQIKEIQRNTGEDVNFKT